MARPPLHTLATFRVIARTANLRAAADELHLTHSAVSHSPIGRTRPAIVTLNGT